MPDNDANDASLSNQGNANGDNGGVATMPTWMEQLENDLKADKELSQFKNISELGKTYIDLKGKTTGLIKVPGEKATEEEMVAFKKAIGVPDKPEEYKLAKPSDYPTDMPFDEQLVKNFGETALKLNLTPPQVQGIYKMFLDYDVGVYKQINQHITENRDKSVNILKNIWKGDTYTANTEETKRSFKETLKSINIPTELGGADAVIKEFDESGFGDHPAMVYFFHALYQKISDDKFIGGGLSGTPKSEPGMLDFSKSMGKKE